MIHERRRSGRPALVCRDAVGPDTGGPSIPRVEGYAAVFESPSVELTEFDPKSDEVIRFTEVITRGAFTEALQSTDVRCLLNHDDRLILARTGNGSLRLEEDDVGLKFSATIPATSYGHDLIENTRAGLSDQCSFGFDIPDGGDEWTTEGDTRLHRINRCALLEISIGVTFPAYPATSFALRSARAAGRLRWPAPVTTRSTHRRTNARRWLDLL